MFILWRDDGDVASVKSSCHIQAGPLPSASLSKFPTLRPKAVYRENGPNPEILASQDSNDATEEAMGHG